jgi:hypothetical protein
MMEALSPPKRRFLQEPHGVMSKMMALFVVTAVKTSNLAFPKVIYYADMPLFAVQESFCHFFHALRSAERFSRQ